jgi:hypothetical protein
MHTDIDFAGANLHNKTPEPMVQWKVLSGYFFADS